MRPGFVKDGGFCKTVNHGLVIAEGSKVFPVGEINKHITDIKNHIFNHKNLSSFPERQTDFQIILFADVLLNPDK